MPDNIDINFDDVDGKKSLWESEYGHIIETSNKFRSITRVVHFSSTSVVSERMKIFFELADIASKKEELMDPYDYFNLKVKCPVCEGEGCNICGGDGVVTKKVNKYSRTFSEDQIREYVAYLHQRVLDLMNQKVVPNYLRGGNGRNTHD